MLQAHDSSATVTFQTDLIWVETRRKRKVATGFLVIKSAARALRSSLPEGVHPIFLDKGVKCADVVSYITAAAGQAKAEHSSCPIAQHVIPNRADVLMKVVDGLREVRLKVYLMPHVWDSEQDIFFTIARSVTDSHFQEEQPERQFQHNRMARILQQQHKQLTQPAVWLNRLSRTHRLR